jgi:hypothetical protein
MDAIDEQFPKSWAIHLDRTRNLLRYARAHRGSKVESDFVVSAAYACRALYEWLLTEEGNESAEGAAEEFARSIRWFKLVEYLRIHDFHRGAVFFRDGSMQMSGPFTFKARGKNAFVGMKFGGFEKIGTGNSTIKMNRPLMISGFSITDPDSEKIVDVRQALTEYVSDARSFFHVGKYLKP